MVALCRESGANASSPAPKVPQEDPYNPQAKPSAWLASEYCAAISGSEVRRRARHAGMNEGGGGTR